MSRRIQPPQGPLELLGLEVLPASLEELEEHANALIEGTSEHVDVWPYIEARDIIAQFMTDHEYDERVGPPADAGATSTSASVGTTNTDSDTNGSGSQGSTQSTRQCTLVWCNRCNMEHKTHQHVLSLKLCSKPIVATRQGNCGLCCVAFKYKESDGRARSVITKFLRSAVEHTCGTSTQRG